MEVRSYRLTAANGRHIRMATKVILADGKEIRFMEKLSKSEALRQVAVDTYNQHLAVARSMGLDTLRKFHATTPKP